MDMSGNSSRAKLQTNSHKTIILDFIKDIISSIKIKMEEINKKISEVLKMSLPDRYDYFIRKVADFENIWGLNSDGWALYGDDEGNQVLPLWPEKEFAELCAVDEWRDYIPEAIGLENFLCKWVPGMTNDKTLISVFPTLETSGLIISPSDINKDLLDESKQYD